MIWYCPNAMLYKHYYMRLKFEGMLHVAVVYFKGTCQLFQTSKQNDNHTLFNASNYHSRRLPGNLPSNHKVPDSMPNRGFVLLLFPWARNFTPIASATQLLNREHIVLFFYQGTAEKQL